MSPLSRRRFVAGMLAAPVVAACGGGGDDEDGAAGPTTDEPSTSTASTSTTTTAPPPPPPPVQPLTGLVHGGDPAILARPALVVKINNIDARETARPQSGINEADVVFEERTEGGISRFAAVFHSTDVDPLLPVRSARYTDLDIVSMLNRPLFANSGGNEDVLNAVRSANVVPIGHADVGNDYYYRVGGRPAPHNLASSTPLLYSLTPGDAQPPPPLFTYRAPGTPVAYGVPTPGVHIEYGGGPAQAPVDHIYDPNLGGWARFQHGTPHTDINGVQVAPPNLIVQFIPYDDVTGLMGGVGEAWVFTGDQVVVGTWARGDAAVPTVFLDPAGVPIPLLPGRTWVLLPPPGGGAFL